MAVMRRVAGCLLLIAVSVLADDDESGDKDTVHGHDKKVLCYWGTWANYRPKLGKFTPESVDGSLCTHLIYSFAGLDNAKWAIKSLDAWMDLETDYGLAGFRKATDLRDLYPHLKVMIAIGGWNEGSTKYSQMARDAEKRGKFVNSTIKFLKKHKFDGLDLDWEYPAKRGGAASDKKNFILLVKELKEAFAEHKFLLTAAIGAGKATIDVSYNVKAMYEYLDFVNVMCYDYHGKWNKKTGHNAPLYARPNESGSNLFLNVDYTINYLMKKGAKPEKTVLGVPLYGRSFLLKDKNRHGMDSPSRSTSFAGPLSREQGFLGYNEICAELTKDESNWTSVWENCHKAPYMFKGDRWVSYDNEKSLRMKVDFAMDHNLGGVMTWSIETDDFSGRCGNNTFPLLRTLNHQLSVRAAGDDGKVDDEENACDPEEYGASAVATPTSDNDFDDNDFSHDFGGSEEHVPVVIVADGEGGGVCLQPNGPNPDPTDCSQFYLCAGGVPHVISCRPGTLYSPGLMTCDHAANVPCEVTSTTTAATSADTSDTDSSSSSTTEDGAGSTKEASASSTEPATASTGAVSRDTSIVPIFTPRPTPVRTSPVRTTPVRTSPVPDVTVSTSTVTWLDDDINNDISNEANNEYAKKGQGDNSSSGVRAETVIIILLVLILIGVTAFFCYCYRTKVLHYTQPYLPKAASLPRMQRPSTVGLLQACKLDNIGKISWPMSHKNFTAKIPRPYFSNGTTAVAPVPPPRQKRSNPEAPSLHYATSPAPDAPRLATIATRPLPRPPAPDPVLAAPTAPLPDPPAKQGISEKFPRIPRGVTLQIGPPMGVTINGVTLESSPPVIPPHASSTA